MTTTSAAVRQLSDANSQGTVLGQSATDKIAFYTQSTSVPVAQQSLASLTLNALAAGIQATSQAGTITKYQVSVVTNSAAATTTTEQTSNVGASTSNVWCAPATSSVIWVNSPASTAGLGVAGYRVSGAGTIAINYLNVSNAAINMAAGNYDVIEIKAGPLTTSAVLSPAAVSLNTSAEQIFTITGTVCQPGTVGIVNKPTAQTGLGYNGMCRVVGVNQVGITFFAVSSGVVTTAITPTAAETYQFAFLPQLNCFNPTYVYLVPAGQNATNASSVTEATSTVTGVVTTDVVTGISRAASTTLTSTAVTGGRITAANTVGIEYLTVLGAQTPPSSEVYSLTLTRQTPLNPNMLYVTTLAATTCAATSVVEATTSVLGLLVSSSVAVNKPTVTPGLTVLDARVSASSTIAVKYMNMTTTSINVPSETYTIANVQLQGPGVGIVSSGATAGAGLAVMQSYYPAVQQSATWAAALRQALLNLNLIAA
jgi:hypothetical protein